MKHTAVVSLPWHGNPIVVDNLRNSLPCLAFWANHTVDRDTLVKGYSLPYTQCYDLFT